MILRMIDEARALPITEVDSPRPIFAEWHESSVPHRDIVERQPKSRVGFIDLVNKCLKFFFGDSVSVWCTFIDDMPHTDECVSAPGDEKEVAVLPTQDCIRVLRPGLY